MSQTGGLLALVLKQREVSLCGAIFVEQLLMTESDAELVQRTLDGDLAAFETLIKRYERSVRSVARAFLADVHACEDATQEIFVAAFRAIPTLRESDRFGPWLMQTARRVAGKIRDQHARRPTPQELDEPEAQPPRIPNPQTQFLLTLTERLPEHERLVVTMRYFDGHSSQEIVDATGSPLGTVTKQLSRAYERLREWLTTSKEIVHE